MLAPAVAGRPLRRGVVAVSGSAVVVVGLLLVPLPGPGWPVVAAGTALLGTEFPWAARLTGRLRAVLRGLTAVADRLPGGRVLLGATALVLAVWPLLLL